MPYYNHLKNFDAQRQVKAVAAGRHVADGTLFLSYVEGSRLFLRQVLGEGEWDAIENVYYEGARLPSADWQFFAGGANSTASTYFSRDTSHAGSVMMDVKAPEGYAAVPADERKLAVAFCRCEKFPDFDSLGFQINASGDRVSTIDQPLLTADFTYTANPARVLVGLLLKYAGKTFSRRSFDWAKWVAWRNFCAATEPVDYRVIAGEEGSGISVDFFTGTNFTNKVETRVDPYINFETSTGSPSAFAPGDSFSARYEGFIKADYSQTYTFTVQHNDSVKLWIDNVFLLNEASAGTHTATAALTAGAFHAIKIEWANSTNEAELVLKWQSAAQALQIIPQKAFYPRVEQRPRYEAHVAFSSPANAETVITTIMDITNSVHQQIGGLEIFECIEQKPVEFELDATDVLTDADTGELKATWQRLFDIRAQESFDIYEGVFRDLDSRYLTEVETPVRVVVNPSAANPRVKTIPFADANISVNLTRWQAYKILKHKANREALKDLIIDLETRASTYSVMKGDIVRVNLFNETGVEEFNKKAFLTVEAEDDSPESTADTRKLKLQEWFEPVAWATELELEG